MKLRFTEGKFERAAARGKYDLLVGAVATLTIWIAERVLYREVMFPVVELAVALRGWLSAGFLVGEAFEFVSLESDDQGLVWLRPEAEGWRIGSLHQEYPELRYWSTQEVADAVAEFVEDVSRWLAQETGVDLGSLA